LAKPEGLAKSEVDGAAPIRDARLVIYLDFFFAFFFFAAITLFPSLCDEPTAGLVQSQAYLGLGPWAFAPLPRIRLPQRIAGCNRKIENNPDFSVA
jgi:hypothetical protein